MKVPVSLKITYEPLKTGICLEKSLKFLNILIVYLNSSVVTLPKNSWSFLELTV